MLPLDGIKVLSFGVGGVGPDFGKIMGELGADVVKIESKDNLDFMRTTGPDINNIPGFNESNRNKRSFGVSLKTQQGKEIVLRLVEWCDILVENYRGGVTKSLGLDYENVREINPNIIYASSQGFGGGGPYSQYQAYGPMLSGTSGMLSLWAHQGDPYPVGSHAPIPDHIASKYLVTAALAALDYKRRTGKGQFIDMAQTEVAVGMIGEYYLDYTMNHRIPKPMGNRCSYAAPHGCYRCKGNDEWCAITIFTDEEWHSFCEVIGNPPWTKEPRFADLVSRLQNVDELDKRVEEWTFARDGIEVMNTLQAAGVPAGIAQQGPESIADPQLNHDNAIVELDHPVAGKRLYPNVAFRMSEVSGFTSTPAPILGQHTDEICIDVLGISEDNLRKLKEEGILETTPIHSA